MIPPTMSQVIMFVLLSIFVLGSAAIIFSHVNILWRSFFSEKRNRLSPSEEPTIQPIGLKVVARHDMSARHFSVRLQAINGTTLTRFLPGQFLTLIIPQQSCEKLNEKAASQNVLKRCYSLAEWKKQIHFYELGIQRENQGKVSSWLHENLQIGKVINALPPKGSFVFDVNLAQHTALVAGGIGITPLRAMIHKFIENNKKAPPSNKTMSLFYSAKSVEEMCYVNEFIQLAQEFSNFLFYPFLSPPYNLHSIQVTVRLSLLRDE